MVALEDLAKIKCVQVSPIVCEEPDKFTIGNWIWEKGSYTRIQFLNFEEA